MRYLYGVVFALVIGCGMGSPKALYALGTWYLHGTYVKKDVEKAFSMIKDAADKSVDVACYDLAVSYEEGIGTKKDLKKAFEYYLKAALLGDKQSIYEIGRCYYYGLGTNKNTEVAAIWLDMANYYGIE